VDALKRAEALEAIRDTEGFSVLSEAAKRVRNIIKKSATESDLAQSELWTELLEPGAEDELYRAYRRAWQQIGPDGPLSNDYSNGFRVIANLRPAVAEYFNQVRVIVDDENLRRNRLCQLRLLDEHIFRRFADLSQIESATLT
jgi:glycyl-tRNA synthetase beta chain